MQQQQQLLAQQIVNSSHQRPQQSQQPQQPPTQQPGQQPGNPLHFVYLEPQQFQNMSLQDGVNANSAEYRPQPQPLPHLPPPLQNYDQPPPRAISFADETFWAKEGMILNFMCTNIGNASIFMGATRTNVRDPGRIPAFIEKNKQNIKLKAIELYKHYRIEVSWGTAAADEMGLDDYGISFNAGSLSMEGYASNPQRRNEGPLFYFYIPGFLREWIFAGPPRADGSPNRAHVVNVYLTCNHRNVRYHAVLDAARKQAQEERQREADPRPGNKRFRIPDEEFRAQKRQEKEALDKEKEDLRLIAINAMDMRKQLAAQQAQQAQMAFPQAMATHHAPMAPVPQVPAFPPLPMVEPPAWPPAGGSVQIPDDE